ncbi:M15 family metallopeptidase [Mycolicibacterium doricum]|uniref:Peptidase M15 n=1 Tax=Mycolicibacterium doricum TaxID=126673 RepID=A0A1X1TES6_9MYCO|nr:M15 family metallopeptidase [Mycolicibacterium doricum]MCV7267710.1 M15 family metallopeptidase [Mycolicibacterium doricum]ORV43062.1 peptidase M15 [Mycolicibacterium doricum]
MSVRRTVWTVSVALGCACGVMFGAAPSHADPAEPGGGTLVGPSATGTQPSGEPFGVGPAATDTFGGYLPESGTLTAFDVENPIVGRLDPALLTAVQEAARAAAADGVEVGINSGWRSIGFQERLFQDGVRTYGSVEIARQFVASPQTSMHVVGRAVDVGGPDAAAWMSRNGPRFGLCQVYANELWHYELTADADGICPPMKPNATG